MYYCNRVVVEAPGKVNLSLDITGSTPDGYHLLDTVMAGVSLCDVLVISKRNDGEIRVTCSNRSVPEGGMNIAYTAAEAFFQATGADRHGLTIHIDKSIPVEAGLAGGSADAAAVLTGLNRLFEMSLSPEQLGEIAFKVGMDVPFCLMGGIALAQGRGEILTPLKHLPPCYIAIAKPPRGMSTHYAFKLYDDYSGELGRPDTQKMLAGIAAGDLTEIGHNMWSVFSRLGNIDETEMLSGIMLCSGALGSVLSGSGSAVIGLFEGEKDAKACLRLLKEQVPDCWLAKPLTSGARVVHAG